MNIISPNHQLDTEKDIVVLAFKSDDELSHFIEKLITTPVNTSGIRILTLVPENAKINPLQSALLDVITGLDGMLGKETKSISDITVEKLKNIIETYKPTTNDSI